MLGATGSFGGEDGAAARLSCCLSSMLTSCVEGIKPQTLQHMRQMASRHDQILADTAGIPRHRSRNIDCPRSEKRQRMKPSQNKTPARKRGGLMHLDWTI